MLEFFRNNAKIIGWVIFSFFALTMFAGTVLVKGMFGDSSQSKYSSEDRANAVAFIGEEPVTNQAFEEAVNQIVSRVDIQKAGGRLSPDLQELIQFNAMNQVVNNMILLKGAEEADIDVSGQEMDQAIQGVLVQYDLRDEKALRAELKKNKKDYGEFKESIEESVRLQKFVDSLKNSVTVSNADVENEYVQLHVRHILLRVSKPEEDSAQENKIKKIAGEISKGLGFENAVNKYSEDIGTRAQGGDIGWISYGSTVPAFEKVAYALKPGQISQPVRTTFGYHLIQLLEVRKKDRPANINFEAEKQRILAKKQENAVQSFIQEYFAKHPLTVNYSPVSAYRAKMEGDYQKALGEYQLMLSRNTYNPVPHYFIGQIYLLLKEHKLALDELKKGEIKIDLNPQMVLPELFLALADAYENTGDSVGMANAYKKAVINVQSNPALLQQLIPVLEKKNMTGLAAEAKSTLAKLQQAAKQPASQSLLPSQPQGAQ